MIKRLLITLLLTVTAIYCYSQSVSINPDLKTFKWNARWITYPNASVHDYGVFHFRKTFDLDAKPDSFIVHVSADNRYRLFVNGTPVSRGPARGDVQHWYYESVNIAPFLVKGKNLIAAVVWNAGDEGPGAQMSFRTYFILQGNTPKEEIVNTDKTSWKAFHNQAYSAPIKGAAKIFTYTGPGDKIDAKLYPWGWETLSFNDKDWKIPGDIVNGYPNAIGTEIFWGLTSRTIPMMEEKLQRIPVIRRSSDAVINARFLSGTEPLIIPPHANVTILLDQTFETNAYPELKVSGGNKAEITLSYAEALFDAKGEKGNRNEIEGKTLLGISDVFTCDGGKNRIFSPLWFRTYRYLEMNIVTADEPLTVHDFYGTAVGYPFKQNASFESSDPVLGTIWNIGWRTAKLCAMETYMDCPYYEQLQYLGDTRIQALISLHVSGDDRLMRNAIIQFDNSRIAEGLPLSRYPCLLPQIIPPFSLFWVDMVYDHWMFKNDTAFVKSKLPGIKSTLDWFETKIDPKTGMLGIIPYWNFVDWPDEWKWDDKRVIGGSPEGVLEGGSSNITLQYIYALQNASKIFRSYRDTYFANHYKTLAESLQIAVMKHCWDDNSQLIAETPSKKTFSQHANTFAVLTNTIPKEKQQSVLAKILKEKDIILATTYFRFYLLQAVKAAGAGDQYIELLGPWKDMLKIGLSTFAEKPEPTRSDCHAWSAGPTAELIATVLGIEPGSAGFASVKIEPHLSTLTWAKGKMPHDKGEISVDLKRKGKMGLTGKVVLPKDLKGTFVWNGKTILLNGNENVIAID